MGKYICLLIVMLSLFTIVVGIELLIPFIYFNITKITDGEFSTLVDNPSINVLTGSIVFWASTLLTTMVGHALLSRKSKNEKTLGEFKCKEVMSLGIYLW